MGYIGGRAVPVIDFWKTLQSEPEKGKAPVVRLTHVKNLDSSLAHEYLQLIIVTEKGRERVVVERTDPDQFIFNGEWKMPKLKWFPDPLNLAKTDLPLPLYSLGWEESKAPTLAQITDICKATHDSAPDYSLIKGKHCYWYALVVYEAVKRAYPGEEKQWRFSFARGMPTFLGDATLMKGDAAAFQKERATGTSADTSGDPTPKDAADETAKSLQKALKEAPEEFKEEYTQELAPEEVVQTSIVDDLDVSTKPQEHLAAPAEASPWDILEGYSVLINAMNEDPKRDEYIGIARDAEIAYNNKDRAPTDPIMISPYSDEYGYDKVTKDSYEMRNATDALIGKVLKQVGVTPKVEPPSVVSDA